MKHTAVYRCFHSLRQALIWLNLMTDHFASKFERIICKLNKISDFNVLKDLVIGVLIIYLVDCNLIILNTRYDQDIVCANCRFDSQCVYIKKKTFFMGFYDIFCGVTISKVSVTSSFFQLHRKIEDLYLYCQKIGDK